MQEFIHGVNKDGENNPLKKAAKDEGKKSKSKNKIKCEKPEPKYKNLIIGDSYIIESTKTDLIRYLID